MVRVACLLALCQLHKARRIQPVPAVEEPGSAGGDSYVCKAGRGQAGQNYASLVGSRGDCQGRCDADAACLGFEFNSNSSVGEQPCLLFGANVPHLGAKGSKDYCLRTSFSKAPAKSVPGDGKFQPNVTWLEETLQVPVKKGACKELGGGGIKGASGAQFFSCGLEYEGSVVFPSLGLPTKLFLKVRTPVVMPHEFDVERQVYALAANVPQEMPVPALLSGARNHLLLESAGSGVERDQVFSDAEVMAIVESYATVHSSFWGIKAEGLQLKSVREWSQIFGGVVGFKPEQVAMLMKGARLPSEVQQLTVRMGTDVGYLKCLQYLLSRGQTLVQGDAHVGQVLYQDDGSAGGKWSLADFGWAHLNNPAVDIGAILPKLTTKKKHEKYLKHYWQKFSEPLGDKLSVDYEEFAMLFKLGAFFRGTFKIGVYFFEAPGKPRVLPPDFFDDGKITKSLLEWFQFLDEEMVEYFSKKTAGLGSSLLSISELPAPSQAVFHALGERELAVL